MINPEIPQSETKTFFVKLFHPSEGCANDNKSERFEFATTQQQLRTMVETQQKGELFIGDKCRKCGSLAKVSYHTE